MFGRILWLIFILGFRISFSQAAILDLDSCVHFALKNRVEVEMNENAQRDAKRGINYARQEIMPGVNATYSHYYNIGRSLNMERYAWENSHNQYGNLSATFGMNLFSGFALLNKIRESKFLYQRSQTMREKIENDIKLEVAQLYYQVIAAQSNVELNQKFYMMSKEREERLRILEREERVPKIELLQAEAGAAKSLSDVVSMKKQYQSALMRLKQCMNFPIGEELTIKGCETMLSPVIPSTMEVYRAALALLPDIEMLVQDSLILQMRLRQTKAGFYPSLSLSGGIFSRYQKDLQDPQNGGKYTLFDQISNNNYKQLGISLSIPIYNQSKAKRQLRALQTEFLNMRLEQNQKRRGLYYEINELCLEVKSRQENCELLKMQVEKYKEVYELRKIQYEKGDFVLYDLLEVENTFRTAEVTFSMEYMNLCYYLKVIDFYMGIF